MAVSFLLATSQTTKQTHLRDETLHYAPSAEEDDLNARNQTATANGVKT